MTSYRWEGVATAQSSIAHGAESLGTVTYLRRERFIAPNGTLEELPVVSGNAWRGLLRDTSADLWWEAVQRPKLTLPVMHALWSGGSLAKSSGPTLTGSRLQELKVTCPVVGVFGTAGGGRIIGGALQVGKMIPICQETAHLVPERFHSEVMPSIWDLTQIEYYSRIPNTFDHYASEDDEATLLARYGVETFVAGTRFYTWVALSWPTPAELALFVETLSVFTSSARVGGLARAGHGELHLNLDAPDTEGLVDWRSAVTAVPRPRLLEVLSWLD
jgi:hypothetical protein